MKRLSLLTISLFASMSVNAAYVIRMPLEQSLSGSLPDHSIKFSGQLEIPEVEKNAAEICNEKIQPTIDFLAANYSDVFYSSHEFSSMFFPVPTPEYRDGCQLTLNFPKSKGASCSPENDYAESTSNLILQRGFDVVFINYYGTCS
ncbi:hypothetical protein [Pseudomonas hormoni]